MKDFRKGIGVFLINTNNQLWVGKRIDFKNDYWQMPQGGIDNNESPRQAMIRELSEECGIKKNYEILMELEGMAFIFASKLSQKNCMGRKIRRSNTKMVCL